MTVTSSETRLLSGTAPLLPRVNLLPPEIAEKRAVRKVQMGLGGAVVASLGVVGLLFLSATHSVSSANEQLDAATQRGATLQAEAAKYNNVTAIYAQAAAAQTQLTTAMGDEVRVSQLLNDLALSVPESVWLKTLTFAPAAAPPANAPTGTVTVAGANTAAAVAAVAPIGTFTVTGTGFSHDDVALWLDSVAGIKTYANPYFSSSTEKLLGTKVAVDFSSTADLTSAALSGRYTKAGG